MNESFSTINYATDGVGAYPQVQKFRDGYDPDAADSVRNLPRYGSAQGTPNLDAFVIESDARDTDLLSCALGLSGMLISRRLFDLLRAYRMQESYSSFPAICYKSGQPRRDYLFLHMPHYEAIEDREFSPREVSEILAARDSPPDIFTLRRPSRLRGTYIAQRLAEKIQAAGCDGVRFGRGKLRQLRAAG